jgi:hypothetical protein
MGPGFGQNQLEVIVVKGCAGSLFQNGLVGAWLCKQLQYNQVFFQQTGGDVVFRVAWIYECSQTSSLPWDA